MKTYRSLFSSFQFLRDLDNHLKQPGKITNLLGSIETKTGIKRLYIVGGMFEFIFSTPIFYLLTTVVIVLVALQALYLLFGGAWAQFICNVIGFIYPAYASWVYKTTDFGTSIISSQILTTTRRHACFTTGVVQKTQFRVIQKSSTGGSPCGVWLLKSETIFDNCPDFFYPFSIMI